MYSSKVTSGWTPERRARQAALIRTWKPWQQATGPRTTNGKAITSRNAYKGGHWLKLRELTKMVNAEIEEARELVANCKKGEIKSLSLSSIQHL